MDVTPSFAPIDALSPIVQSLEAGDNQGAAASAMEIVRATDDAGLQAWALSLYAVAETRNQHFQAALDAFDTAHELARTSSIPRLAERIRIDRLVPLAHVSPEAFPRALTAVQARVGGDPFLTRVFADIEVHLRELCPAAADRMPSTPLRLVSENLPTEQSVYLQDGPVRIGRQRRCDLQIMADGEVSRLHCEVVFREDGWHVVDVSSRGNTVVVGCPSATGPLRPGAHIQLGATILRVCA